MINFIDVILIALFIEAIVEAIKPLWTKGENKLCVSELVSMGMGILLAVTCKINMLSYVVELDWSYPVWVEYIFYILTGIAIGRGTNFLYDLWEKLKGWKGGQFIAPEYVIENSVDVDDLTDDQLRAVLMQLGVPVEQLSKNKSREELERLLDGFAVGGTEPPNDGGAE